MAPVAPLSWQSSGWRHFSERAFGQRAIQRAITGRHTAREARCHRCAWTIEAFEFHQEQARLGYLLPGIPNHQKPIPEEDYQLIFDELGRPPIQYSIRPLKPRQTAETARRRPKLPVGKGPPDHDDLRDIIRDIGQMKKLVAETEYPINDIQLDVA